MVYKTIFLLFFVFIFMDASTIAYWSFENNLVSSVGGSTLTGTAQGTIGYSSNVAPTAQGNQSLYLSSSYPGSYVKMNGTTNITGNLNALTIETYVKFDLFTGTLSTIYSEDSVVRSTYLGYTNDGNYLRFFISQGSISPLVSSVEVLDVPLLLNTNQWYHIAAIFDGSAKTLSLFLDGQIIGSRSVSVSTIPITSVVPTVGAWSYSQGTLPLYGHLDEMRISDTALSSSQFLYSAQVPECSTLIGLVLAVFFIFIKR